MKSVRIQGGTFSGLVCSAALARLGWKVFLQQRPVRLPLTVVINDASTQLLTSLFGLRPASVGCCIDRKSVRWGNSITETSTVDEPSWVFNTRALLNQLRACLKHSGLTVCHALSQTQESGDWAVTCETSNTAPFRFGSRTALISIAQLNSDWDRGSLLMEDTDIGWLFVAPIGNNAAIVQAVVSEPPDQPEPALREIIGRSRITSAAIRQHDAVNIHQIRPRLNPLVARGRTVSCGSAVFACDPISGDGIGFSSRAALLAAAALDAAHQGDSEALDFYRFRLSTAYAAHSRACLEFYRSSQFARSWQNEIQTLEAAIDNLDRHIRKPSRWYVLDNLALCPTRMAT